MKLIIFACILAVSMAAPQADERSSGTLRFENVNEGSGHFQYGFDTDTGISIDAVGTPGSQGQSNIDGTFSFPLGDGSVMEVSYVADENGYRPSVRVVRA